jgi:hypothetical protein
MMIFVGFTDSPFVCFYGSWVVMFLSFLLIQNFFAPDFRGDSHQDHFESFGRSVLVEFETLSASVFGALGSGVERIFGEEFGLFGRVHG